jgi:DNA-binding response OmpR family regulator
MAVTHSFAIGREQCFQQVERLTKSHSLHSSESLCKLLRYLAEHSLDHPGVALKEYQIATEVLGRPAGFDPQSDSTVRVQAGRLRVKLAEYYAHEGADDPILVEIRSGISPTDRTVRENG